MKKYGIIKFVLLGIFSVFLLYETIYFHDFTSSDKIPEGYIAVFHGGSGEKTYSTYIYKIDNGLANSGFEYINTTNTTLLWGKNPFSIHITSKGNVHFTDDVFRVAEKNNAYSYVKLKDSDKTYTIDEYMAMFLMN